MATFIRFMRGADLAEATTNAQADLDRGYSYAGYADYPTEASALASDLVAFHGVDPDTACQHENGTWGFRLEGLCGYEHDRDAISDYPYAANADFYALFEGEYLGSADQGDGDVFRPTALLSVAAVS
ncbi:MAG TPA: hypothetical protein VN837_05550 [Chloroflexota bacterium]|nr:hypothetical protein [Chloroflexota bacterium]